MGWGRVECTGDAERIDKPFVVGDLRGLDKALFQTELSNEAIFEGRSWDTHSSKPRGLWSDRGYRVVLRNDRDHLAFRSLSNSDSVRISTPSSLALSYLEPGSVPTTT